MVAPPLTDTWDDPGDSPEPKASEPRPRRASRGVALTFAAAAVACAALLAPRALAVAAAPASPAPTVARLFAKFAPAEEPAPPPEPPAPPPAFARLTGKPATPLPRDAPEPKEEPPAAEEAPRLSDSWKKAIYGATGIWAALFLGGYVLFMPKKPASPPDEVKHPRVLNIQSPEPVRVAPPSSPAPKVPPPSPAAVKASRKELLARVRVVLEKGGCDVDKARKAGKNMVFAAAESGNVEALKMLVAAGADVNAPATSGETPVNAAKRKGHVAAREYLLARGAVAKTPTKAKRSFF